MNQQIIPWYRRSPDSMRNFYNLIHLVYGLIEGHLGPKLDRVLSTVLPLLNIDSHQTTALEYACGSGLLSLKLAPHFSLLTCRDQSCGMLERAKRRALKADLFPRFEIGNMLDITESPDSVDYVFISFALHLFSSQQRQEILTMLRKVVRKEVIVIDHCRKSDWLTEWVERIEGSHYDEFIREDFDARANDAGFKQVVESEVATCMVLRFQKT